MASKQLGKLRQWAGEVISSKDKTTFSEEFFELEQDVELRRQGVHRLNVACRSYHKALSKRKECEVLEVSSGAKKWLPIDALGMVMIAHGEEFGDDSTFGSCLAKLGRAHCKIATMQEAFALTLQDTFIASLEKFDVEFKEYETLKKKLESRRLSYDAAIARLEKAKGGKKDKEKKEAEEEHEKAKLRFEETSDELHAQMHSIQDNEINQLRDITEFLDLETRFVEQYLEVLTEVKDDWTSVTIPKTAERRPAPRKAPSASTSPAKQTKSNGNYFSSSSDDESQQVHRSANTKRKKSDASTTAGKTPSSRASSRSSHKHLDAPTEKDTEKLSKRLSVTGWASAVTGRGKKTFAALTEKDADVDEADRDIHAPIFGGDYEDDTPGGRIRTGSFSSKSSKSKRKLSKVTPPGTMRILKPPALKDRKVVRALYDFSGSSDELAFKAGDEIVVVNEVLEEWWMGELSGRKGLFPTAYTEVIAPGDQQKGRSSFSSEVDSRNHGNASDTSDLDEDRLAMPLDIHMERSPFYGGRLDVVNFTSTDDDDGPVEQQPQPPMQPPRRVQSARSLASPPIPMQRSTTNPEMTSGAKRRPPPPPARRPTLQLSTSSRSSMSARAPLSLSVQRKASPFDDHEVDSAAAFIGTGCGDFRQNPFKPKGTCSNCFAVHD